MKCFIRIISLAFALIASAACNKNEIESTNGYLKGFEVVLENQPETKSSDLQMKGPEGSIPLCLEKVVQTKSVQINHSTTFTEIYDSFQVEGREHGNQVFYDFAQYNASTGLWSLQNAQYIWKPGKEIEVVAAATGMGETATDAFFSGVTYNGSPSTASFNYTLPEHADQQDFLVGYFRGVTDNGTVALKFNHPLTSLVFETGPLPLGVTLKVNSITLEGIDASARCDITFGENTTYTWSAHSGTVNYSQEIDKPAMVEGDVILGEDASFIVIPRKFPANSEARILLNITDNGRTYDMYAPLAGQEWKPGETNIYQISYHGESKAVILDGFSLNNALADLIPESDISAEYTYPGGRDQYTKIPKIKKIIFDAQSNVNSGILVNAPGAKPIYMNYNSSNQTVTFSTSDIAFYTGESANYMFSGLVDLQEIQNLNKLDTRDAISLRHMFSYCVNLQSLDLSNFNTNKATDVLGIFQGCESITNLNLSSFNTDNINNAAWMFINTKALQNITFGDHFQLPKCTVVSLMFAGSNVASLDLSFMLGSEGGCRTSWMFLSCPNLTSVKIDHLRATDGNRPIGMFLHCKKIASIDFGTSPFFDNVIPEDKQTMFTDAASDTHCNIKCTESCWNNISVGTGMQQDLFTWINTD